MKVSVVIPIYQSHEILSRQIKYFKKMLLPDDIEFIFVDDNSNPPLTGEMRNMTIYRTDNNLAWTQGLARNLGASKAKGKYIFMTDIDHILSKEAIEDALNFNGKKMIFRRKIAVLLEDGTLTQDPEILRDWGWRGDTLDASVHGNTWVMLRSDFNKLGGYSKKSSTWGYHPATRRGDDCDLNGRWNRMFKGEVTALGRPIYLFPISRFHIRRELNPRGLFHDLSHKQEKFYKEGQEC